MSRKGRKPVEIPKEAKITIETNAIRVEGPKGKLSLSVPSSIKVEQKEGKLFINRLAEDKQSRANHGTIQAILVNMVIGVVKGHRKDLDIQGVGFRAQVQGQKLILNAGFSHQVEYDIPVGVKVAAAKPTEISIEGCDSALVGQVASQIRFLKPPEPYKGKGIRYSGEAVRRKQGKSVTK